MIHPWEAALLGLPAAAAAEYSFLLALPTLGAAARFDALTGGRVLLKTVGAGVLALVVLGVMRCP